MKPTALFVIAGIMVLGLFILAALDGRAARRAAEPSRFEFVSGTASTGQPVVLKVDRTTGAVWLLAMTEGTNAPYVFLPVPTLSAK